MNYDAKTYQACIEELQARTLKAEAALREWFVGCANIAESFTKDARTEGEKFIAIEIAKAIKDRARVAFSQDKGD